MTKFSEVFWDFFKRKFYYFLTSAGLLLLVFAINNIRFTMQKQPAGSLEQTTNSSLTFFAIVMGFVASILILIKQEILWRDKKFIGTYRQGQLSFSKLLWANILSSVIYVLILAVLPRTFSYVTSIFDKSNLPLLIDGSPRWISIIIISNLIFVFVATSIHMVCWNIKKGLDLKLSKIWNIVYYGVLTAIIFVIYAMIQGYILMLYFLNFFRFIFTDSGSPFFLTSIIIYAVVAIIVVALAVGLLRGYLKSEIPEIRKGIAEENTEVAK